jgi:YVTN family beta-propeller protein
MMKCLFPCLMIVSMQMASASPFAYVTNYGADNVSVVDLATNAAIGYIDNGGFDITNPVDVRHSPDGTKAYLLADFNNAMFVIDTSLNMIVSQVDSSVFNFNAPNIVRFTPDGTKAYVTNEGGDNISIIDVATDTITGYVTDFNGSCDLPIDIAFSPDGTQAFVANYNGDSIGIIDVASDTIVAMVDTAAFPLDQPTYLNFISSTKAYVTSLNSSQVGIIDVVNQAMRGYVAPGSNSFSLPFSVLATSDGVQEVTMDPGVPQALAWPPATDTVTNVVNGLNSPRYFFISADNSEAFVTDLGTNNVYIVDLSSYTITGFFDGSVFPFNTPLAISISP